MDLKTRLFTLVGAFVPLLAITMAPMVAKAEIVSPIVSDTIVFRGSASAAVPAEGGPPGTFSFTGSNCALVSDPGIPLETGSQVDPACVITVTNGSFINIVCGTGFAEGDVTITTTETGAGTPYASGHFYINFQAGVGVLIGRGVENDDGSTYPVELKGAVVITPDNPQPPPGCTAGFTVNGNASILEAPNAP